MKRADRYLITLALLMAALFAPQSVLDAQVHFTAKEPPIDYSRYPSLLHCAAAVERIADSIRLNDPVWIDTVPMAGYQRNNPFLSAQVVAAAKDCRDTLFSRMSATEAEFSLGVKLLLIRNDSAKLYAWISPRQTETDEGLRAQLPMRMGALLSALQQMPERPLFTAEFLESWMQTNLISVFDRIVVWGKYLDVAKAKGDTALVEAVGNRIFAQMDDAKMASRERDGSEFRSAIAKGVLAKYERELMDTLRSSGPQRYLAYRRKVFDPLVAEGLVQASFFFGLIGESARTIEAAYWYPEKPNTSIPMPGKVSLLVFLDNRSSGVFEPHGLYAILRRLKSRFPALELVLVSRTYGWFGVGPALSVESEGKVFRDWLLTERKIPATLAIDSTPHYFLPPYDERRVDIPSPNDVNYQTVTDKKLGRKIKSVLVSADGFVINEGDNLVARMNETRLAEQIEALLKHAQSGL